MELEFNDIEEALKKLNELKKLAKSHNHKDMLITKSFPCKKEWLDRFSSLMVVAKDVQIMLKKAEVERDNLWSEITKELDTYDGHMTYNEKTGEIDIYSELDKEKSVKSPYVQ